MRRRWRDPADLLMLVVFIGLLVLVWYFGLLPMREAGGQVALR